MRFRSTTRQTAIIRFDCVSWVSEAQPGEEGHQPVVCASLTHPTSKPGRCFLVVFIMLLGGLTGRSQAIEEPSLIRSVASGRWSEASTWQNGKVPAAGARVQVRTGHVVIYDVKTEGAIRSIHVAGTLKFDPDRDTRLDVGLIKIQAGDDAGESPSNLPGTPSACSFLVSERDSGG